MNRKTLAGASSRDPATVYARQVTSGRILAGRAVRFACARHLADLERQATRRFPFVFNRQRAGDAFRFFRDFLTLDDDRPFRLLPWMQFILGSLEGWTDTDSLQRFNTSYVETSKGTGKTPLAAGYGLYGLAGKRERSAEIYSLGVTGDQAAYLFKFAKRMAERSDDLVDILEIGERNIAWLDRDSFFRPLSSEGKSLDNKRPYLALIDELHEHPSSVIPEKMRLGFKGRPDALLFEITNAGHDQTSVCWDHHDYSLKILERRISGDAAERWFAYVCQLDPCAAHIAKGFTQPQDGCQACDHWTDPAVWLKVQPSLGVTISVPQMQSLVDEAIDRPSMQNRIKRLNFCMWTQAHTIWIPSDRWDACAVPAPDRPPLSGKNSGFACAAGFDMSEKLDLTACDIAQRLDDVDDSKAHTVEIEDVDTTGQKTKKAFKINFSIELYSFFWLPEDTLRERVKNEKIPFDQWAADGFLRVTPGPVIDYDEIYDQFMGEIVPTFSPQRTGYDPHNATQFAVQLRDRGKQEIAEVKQGRALSETAKLLEALILLRRVRHNGNPVMGWCVSNANPKRDRYENLWLEKPSATKRIDGVIAGLIALNQLMLLPPVRRRRAKPRKWTPQGFVDAVPDETPGATP